MYHIVVLRSVSASRLLTAKPPGGLAGKKMRNIHRGGKRKSEILKGQNYRAGQRTRNIHWTDVLGESHQKADTVTKVTIKKCKLLTVNEPYFANVER